MPKHAIRSFHLWSRLPDDLWERLSAHMKSLDFDSGETIFPLEVTNHCLCVLIRGRAKVYASVNTGENAALLRTMESGSVFGVHSIFGQDTQAQTHIVAQQPCQLLLIPASVWEEILASHPETMAAYVRFLTQRIQFLNRKIQYLTAGSAERRLALYLLSEIPEQDTSVTLNVSAVLLADLLDVGRATLYRAIDRLTADGFLVRKGHEYRLLRRAELASHYQ